jgi:molybdate transport system permease protein
VRESRVVRSVSAQLLSLLLLTLLGLPIVALLLSSSPSELLAGVRHRLFSSALLLSLITSLISLGIIIGLGTPLAWWIATSRSGRGRLVEVIVDLPVVLPPAVVGVALLVTFGRSGLVGSWLSAIGLNLSFSTAAVVLAQVVVASPFYVQVAANAFRKVDLDLLIVARTLGASPRQAFLTVAVPIALPGLLGGAALAWARALGEFGATLLFAGNLPGVTQTMPLAIYAALESDVRAALAIALVLAAVAFLLLLALRLGPDAVKRARRRRVTRHSFVSKK